MTRKLTVLEVLCRQYSRQVHAAKRLGEELEGLGGKLKRLLKPGQKLRGVQLVLVHGYEADEAVLRGRGLWKMVSREAVDGKKLSALVKLDPTVLLRKGGVHATTGRRLLVD